MEDVAVKTKKIIHRMDPCDRCVAAFMDFAGAWLWSCPSDPKVKLYGWPQIVPVGLVIRGWI